MGRHALRSAGDARLLAKGENAFDAVTARLEDLASSGLDDVAVLRPKAWLTPGGDVMIDDSPAGATSLRELLAWHGPLSVGQCVWWGSAVASALAAMHRQGLSHGALDDGHIWVSDEGVSLSGLADAAATHADAAVAPDDVAALGAILDASVCEADRQRLGAWTESMTSDNPSARPTAAMIARALGSCAPAERIHTTPRRVAADFREGARVTELLPEAQPWRDKVAATKRVLIAGAALVAAVLVVFMVAALADARQGSSHAVDGAPPGVGLGQGSQVVNPQTDPAQAASDLTVGRVDAIARSDAPALLAVTAPATPARAAAVVTAARLRAGLLRVEGLSVTVTAATVTEAGERTTSVRVDYVLSAHKEWTDGEWVDVSELSESAVLTLTSDEQGRWLVEAATAPR